jgi:hypothetical protein
MPHGAGTLPGGPQETEAERVTRWRLGQLTAAGFPPEAATALANNLDVDLHGAIKLVQRGCPPDTAARILL